MPCGTLAAMRAIAELETPQSTEAKQVHERIRKLGYVNVQQDDGFSLFSDSVTVDRRIQNACGDQENAKDARHQATTRITGPSTLSR